MKVCQNHIAKSTIDSLEFNLYFLHSCLNIAAIHFKYTEKYKGLIEVDIMQHYHATKFEYYKAMKNNYQLVLEAALSTIFI